MNNDEKRNPSSLLNIDHEAQLRISDHRLVIKKDAVGGSISIYSPDDSKAFEIKITPSGPILAFDGNLKIEAAGSLDFAAQDISLTSQRSFHIQSEGDLNIDVKGDMTSKADAHLIEATSGDVEIDANDDVIATGERIRLN